MTSLKFDLDMTVLHWNADQKIWDEIGWDEFSAFRSVTEFRPLSGINGGVHCFVVCVGKDSRIVNLIPHKYLIEPNGRVGADNFVGWTREERSDYSRLMRANKYEPGDQERMNDIRDRAGTALFPPRGALFALAQALPMPPAQGSAAEEFLEQLHSIPGD